MRWAGIRSLVVQAAQANLCHPSEIDQRLGSKKALASFDGTSRRREEERPRPIAPAMQLLLRCVRGDAFRPVDVPDTGLSTASKAGAAAILSSSRLSRASASKGVGL